MRFAITLFLCLAVAQAATAEEKTERQRGKGWWWSVAALAGTSVMDTHSSWGRAELNPVLRDGNGNFSGKAVALKAAIAGGIVASQWLLLRRNPRAERALTIANFGLASAMGGVAIRNYGNQGGVPTGVPDIAQRPSYLTASGDAGESGPR